MENNEINIINICEDLCEHNYQCHHKDDPEGCSHYERIIKKRIQELLLHVTDIYDTKDNKHPAKD
jgi:hypothetical protein